MKLTFLADIHISPCTVSDLKKGGYDIKRVTEYLSASAADDEIVKFAIQNNHVIITQDLDFSAIIAKNQLSSPSVISLRLGNVKPPIVTKILFALIPQIKSELKSGAIISVEENNYRIRKLPAI